MNILPHISHQSIHRQNFGITKPFKNIVSEINTGNAIFGVTSAMTGELDAVFHVNLIDQLNEVFFHNNMNFLSTNQNRFITLFFKQAGIVDKYINSNEKDKYKDMDIIMQQLDDFLGSYYGVDNGRYAR